MHTFHYFTVVLNSMQSNQRLLLSNALQTINLTLDQYSILSFKRMPFYLHFHARNVDLLKQKRLMVQLRESQHVHITDWDGKTRTFVCTEKVSISQQSESAKTFITSCKFSCKYFYVAHEFPNLKLLQATYCFRSKYSLSLFLVHCNMHISGEKSFVFY